MFCWQFWAYFISACMFIGGLIAWVLIATELLWKIVEGKAVYCRVVTLEIAIVIMSIGLLGLLVMGLVS